ncbi:MAG TPA: HD domain-containing protein [Edaphocola sp.]|nr:HD domain-containing protein [Edaphocola sp.]
MYSKIINDPVYGFVQFTEQELMKLINHPLFQRLRRIKQMGMAQLVYPGAVHTRFHHSLGACHLMGIALDGLRTKGVKISDEERLAARTAILLHDIGHGPFSHALEHTIVPVSHELISLKIMKELNNEFDGKLDEAIRIFKNEHPIPFLHQLVSSQLDMDRMDYLNRDSFFSGVIEGRIGYDRILQMLTVKDGNLLVEEKGIYSAEKFIVSRRLMYWQVYHHKTVLGAEKLLVNILKRAKSLADKGVDLFATPSFKFFLYEQLTADDFETNSLILKKFCDIDDDDIICSIKQWTKHEDKILSTLCSGFIYRKLYKVALSNEDNASLYEEKKELGFKKGILNDENLEYFLLKGTTSNNTYEANDENIKIAMKDGRVLDISAVTNSLIDKGVAVEVVKYFVVMIPELV